MDKQQDNFGFLLPFYYKYDKENSVISDATLKSDLDQVTGINKEGIFYALWDLENLLAKNPYVS